MTQIGNEWDALLAPEFEKPYYKELCRALAQEYETQTVYPPQEDIFNALRYTSYSDVKAVLLGQDPYHGPGQAHGLCFSVQPGVKTPPSLRNIFKELQSDLQIAPPDGATLTPWAKQGVLLLNSVLTVKQGEANSHHNQGWEDFTDGVIKALNDNCENLVFILWGNSAKQKCKGVDRNRHLVLEAAHPSPLSAYRGFFGCKHFSKANSYLHAHGKTVINWQLPLYLDGSEHL